MTQVSSKLMQENKKSFSFASKFACRISIYKFPNILPAPAKQNVGLYYPQTNMRSRTKSPYLQPWERYHKIFKRRG